MYYVAYGLMLVAGIWSVNASSFQLKKTRKRYFVFWFLLWSLLLGLRHPSMGIDLRYGSNSGYLGQFERIAGMDWSAIFRYKGQYELGYVIFNKILGYFGTDYQILLLACAITTMGIAAIWLYRNSEIPMLATMIFLGMPFFLANFSALRQVIALSITFFAYEMVKKRKLLPFVLLVFLASTFHRTAWVFLVAYPIYWFRVTKNIRLISLIAPLLVYVLRFPLFQLLSRLVKDDAQPDKNNAIVLFLVFFLIYLFCTLFAHYEDREEQGWCNLFLLACLCQAFGGVYSTAVRMGWYFMPYLTLLLPRIIINTEKEQISRTQKDSLVMYVAICVCFGVFGLYSLSKGTWAMSNPYYFFWEKMV